MTLCRVLAQKFWKRDFEWISSTENFDVTSISEGESAVIIGDQCFQHSRNFRYITDLGLEWKRQTGLPFVFACWAASKKQNDRFSRLFNEALAKGVKNKNEAVSLLSPDMQVTAGEVVDYYKNNIDFVLDESKKEAMSLFLRYIKELKIQV